jgi:tripartite-type tricarboxylate transporter receptor subunit TctC
MTPVSMMALDQFVLWVNAENPAEEREGIPGRRQGRGPSKMKMGGTGSKQEDQILTVGIEKATGTKFIYIPFKGGGDVAVQLVASTSTPASTTRSKPWPSGARPAQGPVRVRRQAHALHGQGDGQAVLGDIPTCKEAGVPTEYTMLRGVFMAPGVSKDQLEFYVNLLKKVRETPDWKEYMEKGAFNQTAMTGRRVTNGYGGAENMHRELMKEAGFIAK